MNSTCKFRIERRVQISLLFCALALPGCTKQTAADNPSVQKEFGLQAATGLRSFVERSVTLADSVLDESNGLRLVPGKLEAPLDVDPHRVSVYLAIGAGIPIHVPTKQRFVLIREAALETYLLEIFGQDDAHSPDAESFLAVMLLHEIGHLHHGDTGSFTPAGEVDHDMNRDATLDKQIEMRADQFAADQLQAAWSSKDVTRFTAGIRMQLAITSLEYTVFGRRMIEHFGATTLKSPAVFWDAELTHPNLELRLLSILAILNPTYQPQLDDFMARRAAKPGAIIWRAPEPPDVSPSSNTQ